MTSKLTLLALVFACVSIDANSNFRGGYLTYTLTTDTSSQTARDVLVSYASAWKIGPTDCSDDSGSPIASVRLLSSSAAPFTAANSRVQCATTSTGGAVRFGTNTASFSGVNKFLPYTANYVINTPWFQFPCCTANVGITDANSLSMFATIPNAVTTTEVPNNPAQFSSLLLIEVASGSTTTFTVPATDPENNPINCRFATQGEAGYLGSGVFTNQATQASAGSCTFIIDATNKIPGEYPVGIMVDDLNAQQGVIHSVPYQIVYYVTGTAPNVIDATVTCTQNNMRVEIPISEFAAGTAPLANFVTFAGQSSPLCTSTIIGSNYVLNSALNGCGTTYQSQDATYITYGNTVTIGRDSSTTITRDLTVQISVKCKYTRNYLSENDKSYTATSLVNSQEENFGSFSIQLRAFDSTFTTVIPSTAMSVSLRQRQYCQIDVSDNNFDTVAIVERIFASSSASRNDPLAITHDLFVNRCPNPADSTVQMNNQLSSRSQFRFSFEAFVFTSNTAAQVYVHCNTFICHQSSTDALCNQACAGYLTQPNTNNVGRVGGSGRKRRAIEGENELINGGKLIDLNTPSKNYFLVVGPYNRAMSESNGIEHGYSNQKTFWNKENFIMISAVLVVICIAISAIFYVKYYTLKMMSSVGDNKMVDMDIKAAFEHKA